MPRSYQRPFFCTAHSVRLPGAAAMDFAVHAERLGEVDDLEAGADAADVLHAGARDVAGAGLDPFGAGVELAVGASRDRGPGCRDSPRATRRS